MKIERQVNKTPKYLKTVLKQLGIYRSNKMRTADGFTIVELMVAMGLFSVLTVLVFVSFVNIANIRTKTGSMKDSQQKIRMVTDQMTRMTKEASKVMIDKDPGDGDHNGVYYTLTLTYNKIKMGGGTAAAKTVKYVIMNRPSPSTSVSLFRIDNNCFFASKPLCEEMVESDAGYDYPLDMLSGKNDTGSLGLKTSASLFDWAVYQPDPAVPGVAYFSPPAVRIKLAGIYSNVSAEYDDAFSIDTSVVLSDASYGGGTTIVTTFTVTFNSNGGATVPSILDIIPGNKITDPGVLTKTGYTFSGWYRVGLASQWNFATDGVTEDTTLYAKWTANSYNVTFDKNDAAATGSMATQSITYGVTKPLSTNTYLKAGFHFAGWNTLANGTGTNYDNIANYTMNTVGGVTLYAKWDLDPPYATLYQHVEDVSGVGYRVGLDIGNYPTTAALKAINSAYYGNSVSGIFIKATGYKVEAYTGENYTGTKYTFTASDMDLRTPMNLNDQLNSFKVIKL